MGQAEKVSSSGGRRLKLVAGRPLSVQQQGDVMRNAFTLERAPEDSDESILSQVMNTLGWIVAGLLAMAVTLVAIAAVLSLAVAP